MTPTERIILVKDYLNKNKLNNCKIEYCDYYNILKNEYSDSYILTVGFKEKSNNQLPKIFPDEEHITLEEINKIKEILNMENISFSLVKKENFSIKLGLRFY